MAAVESDRYPENLSLFGAGLPDRDRRKTVATRDSLVGPARQ